MKVIGLISGTSVDGIDAALVEVEGREEDLQVKLLAGHTYPYPQELREQILAVCGGISLSVAQLAQLDDEIATQFALAARLIQNEHPQAELIGSHGQTVFHRPPIPATAHEPFQLGYSVQLGRGAVIANLTGLPTISNFRQADLAAGGQGAPLVSKIDACLLSHPTKSRAIQNLGGIGNVTYLPANHELNWIQQVCGWDTGPGNALLDLAVQRLTNGRQTYDHNGSWAAQGTPCTKLVSQWLKQDFFAQPPPKSTGRELFGEVYLDQCWHEAQSEKLEPADWLATLTELTVASISYSYRHFLPQIPDEVILCGGGSRNFYLRQRLQAELTSTQVLTTDELGINGDFKEAIAFAVLAYWRFCCLVPGNLPQVTGAVQDTLLGEVNYPIANQNARFD
jgi:anhydro-N-acetylmuramic acid kinase